MKRAARAPRRQFVAVITGVLILPLTFLLPVGDVGTGSLLLIALLGAMVMWMSASVLVNMAEVSETHVRFRSLVPKGRLTAILGDVVRYAPDEKGKWYVETSEGRVPVPIEEPWEIHAAFAQWAPRALAPKRLRPQYAPPPEDFKDLWTYDVERLLSETLGRAAAVVLCVALTRQVGGAYGIVLAPFMLSLFEMGGRLDVTTTGLVRRGPFHHREIPWNEAIAVFCERRHGPRSFVITSARAAIQIPDHLAEDLDLMAKVFRSLPHGTLCVNFDETTFQGYKRRRKVKAKEPAVEMLMPPLTA